MQGASRDTRTTRTLDGWRLAVGGWRLAMNRLPNVGAIHSYIHSFIHTFILHQQHPPLLLVRSFNGPPLVFQGHLQDKDKDKDKDKDRDRALATTRTSPGARSIHSLGARRRHRLRPIIVAVTVATNQRSPQLRRRAEQTTTTTTPLHLCICHTLTHSYTAMLPIVESPLFCPCPCPSNSIKAPTPASRPALQGKMLSPPV
ncbi:hypothetical protein IWX49DRAFT_79846 [Phyllosticta citricarpa]|uniref:Uncharacterized protein n=2 Tax=Phyllosticta TaxID=121621 RepID=A0ABR1MRS2_9PEZI